LLGHPHFISWRRRPGLYLGYASVLDDDIESALIPLGKVLRESAALIGG